MAMVHPGGGTELDSSGWYTETIYPARRRLFAYSRTLNLQGDVQWFTPPGGITLTTGSAALAIEEHHLSSSRRHRLTLGSPPALKIFLGRLFCHFFCGMGSQLLTFFRLSQPRWQPKYLYFIVRRRRPCSYLHPESAALAIQVLRSSRPLRRFLVGFSWVLPPPLYCLYCGG